MTSISWPVLIIVTVLFYTIYVIYHIILCNIISQKLRQHELQRAGTILRTLLVLSHSMHIIGPRLSQTCQLIEKYNTDSFAKEFSCNNGWCSCLSISYSSFHSDAVFILSPASHWHFVWLGIPSNAYHPVGAISVNALTITWSRNISYVFNIMHLKMKMTLRSTLLLTTWVASVSMFKIMAMQKKK